MHRVLKCCSLIPWWIYTYTVYINIKTNSPWNNREAVREISIHISMWLCYGSTEGKHLLLSILTSTFFFYIHYFSPHWVAVTELLPHLPGWLFRCLLKGTSETSLSSHTSSRSCPYSQFVHFQELEGDRVDWKRENIYVRLFCGRSQAGFLDICAVWSLKVHLILRVWNFLLHCITRISFPPICLIPYVEASEKSMTLVLTVVQRRTARCEYYWLNGMTTQGQLPAFTLSSSSWRHVAQTVKAPTGSHFKYFRNLPNHILLSQLMVINVSAACHNQTG